MELQRIAESWHSYQVELLLRRVVLALLDLRDVVLFLLRRLAMPLFWVVVLLLRRGVPS